MRRRCSERTKAPNQVRGLSAIRIMLDRSILYCVGILCLPMSRLSESRCCKNGNTESGHEDLRIEPVHFKFSVFLVAPLVLATENFAMHKNPRDTRGPRNLFLRIVRLTGILWNLGNGNFWRIALHNEQAAELSSHSAFYHCAPTQ